MRDYEKAFVPPLQPGESVADAPTRFLPSRAEVLAGKKFDDPAQQAAFYAIVRSQRKCSNPHYVDGAGWRFDDKDTYDR